MLQRVFNWRLPHPTSDAFAPLCSSTSFHFITRPWLAAGDNARTTSLAPTAFVSCHRYATDWTLYNRGNKNVERYDDLIYSAARLPYAPAYV